MDKEKQALVAVWSVEGIGRARFRAIEAFLYSKQLSWLEFWHNPDIIMQAVGFSPKLIAAVNKFAKRYACTDFSDLLEQKDIQVVFESDQAYPSLLCETKGRPPLLFVRGTLPEQLMCPLAVVGTRQITAYGEVATRKIVTELIFGGASIVSGFMYGVDAVAHETAVSQGGFTLGVLGYGFDFLYPKAHIHRKLFTTILESGGCFVTEFAPSVAPRAGNFPARNRLVAGISLGVVVVEAAVRSGTHITARVAAEEGRDVFAIPGPITSEYSEGTKILIQDGAQLVSSGTEILENLGWGQYGLSLKQQVTNSQQHSDASKQPAVRASSSSSLASVLGEQIVQLLRKEALSTSLLTERLPEASVAQVQATLTTLELQGVVVRKGGLLMMAGGSLPNLTG